MNDNPETTPPHEWPLSEQYRIQAKKFVEADAAAQLLEETKTAMLQTWAQDIVRDEGVSGAEAERRVRATERWRGHIEAMVEARKKALLLKCQLEYIRMRHWEKQSDAATQRAEMKI